MVQQRGDDDDDDGCFNLLRAAAPHYKQQTRKRNEPCAAQMYEFECRNAFICMCARLTYAIRSYEICRAFFFGFVTLAQQTKEIRVG